MVWVVTAGIQINASLIVASSYALLMRHARPHEQPCARHTEKKAHRRPWKAYNALYTRPWAHGQIFTFYSSTFKLMYRSASSAALQPLPAATYPITLQPFP